MARISTREYRIRLCNSRPVIKQLTVAFQIKGGWITYLPDQKTPYDAYAKHQKVRPTRRVDWGALRTQRGTGRRGRPPLSHVLELMCADEACSRIRKFRGKTEEQLHSRIWMVGWLYQDGIGWCPHHKPGVEDGRYRSGGRVRNRITGYEYTIREYVGKGDHTLNFGKWPELWCEDDAGREQVFIFWNGQPPEGLVLLND